MLFRLVAINILLEAGLLCNYRTVSVFTKWLLKPNKLFMLFSVLADMDDKIFNKWLV